MVGTWIGFWGIQCWALPEQDKTETKSSFLPWRLEVWGFITSFQHGPDLPTTFSNPHQDSARVYVGLGGAGSTRRLVV